MDETNKTIIEQIESVCEEICNYYCKFPSVSRKISKTDEEAHEYMEIYCKNCPLTKLM